MKRLLSTICLILLLCSSALAQSTAATVTNSNNSQTMSAGFGSIPYTQSTCGAACTINFQNSFSNIVSSVTANTTLTITAPIYPTNNLSIEICQDSTGGRTVAWPANVFDGGAASGTDNVFPLQASKCGTVLLSWDGTNFYIIGKPSLANNCSGQVTVSTSTSTISNKCCTAATNVFVCTDVATTAAACDIACSAGSITIKSAATADTVNWARLN